MKTSDVFGFNYDGSWGSSGLEVWNYHDHGLMTIEIARGKKYFPEWNVARWWLSNDSFQRNPERFMANLEAGLGIFASHGIKVIPVLFNRWRDPVCDFGGVGLEHLIPWATAWNHADDLFDSADPSGRELTIVEEVFSTYLAAVIGAHKGDERIYCWDLCNEPLMGEYVDDPDSPLRAAEVKWLKWCADKVRLLGASQPLTIGNYPGLSAVKATEPFVDILSFHPYYVWNGKAAQPQVTKKEGFIKLIEDTVAFADSVGKGLIASETVWGARDDAKHVEVMRFTLDELAKRGVGFTVHALHHSLISDLHRDEYGPVGLPECLHFIEADGKLRIGHEAFNEFAPSVRNKPAGQ